MMHPGVYRYVDSPVTLQMRVQAARYVLPGDVAVSHTSNLSWRGLSIGDIAVLHFGTNSTLNVNRPGMRVHRFGGQLHPTNLGGVPVLGPDRTFVDCATLLPIPVLVRVGDWLIANRHTDLGTLHAYVTSSHLDGVQRARLALPLLRDGVESVKETDLRLLLGNFSLPEPTINPNIFDATGRFIARGDLAYERYKVLVEYDGWQHERDARQRQHDHLRRERLEANGWRVIVITAIEPLEVKTRVREALTQRGWQARFGV
ncbi:MAG: DUF559 domain-containing protein [Aeromicrobium sp.]